MKSSSSSNSQKILPPSKQFLELNLNQSLSTFQAQCSGFLNHLSHLQSCLFSLHDRAKHSLEAGFSRSISCSFPSNKNPAWARISDNSSSSSPTTQTNLISQLGNAMSAEAIEERLAGVPVYALSNCNEEFVLVSGAKTGKSLGLMCFKKEDAEALLHQMKSMDPAMRKEGSRVVPVPLNKVFQLKVNGVAFRLIPESTQVKNALREMEKAGFSDDAFAGVPVFQVLCLRTADFKWFICTVLSSCTYLLIHSSRSLVLRSQNKSYRPVFFRKEDLEKSLRRASSDQNKLNPAFRMGDIQVAVFEEIIKGMKCGNWDIESVVSACLDIVAGRTVLLANVQ
ncbi:protein TIC 22-like [Citrus sinensis]|uniref:Protein TIC 22-like n=1 Tax=Citrus sinensis TaxID=2711 RepID=A0ACB8HYU5_CITSI|nr:protein TIC 22-like [Citrus sinensis]